MEEMLIIFPSDHQLEYLIGKSFKDKNLYIVLQNTCQNRLKICKGIVFVNKTNEEVIADLKTKDLSVLCCHEEAVYWLLNHDSPSWRLQFNRKYMELLNKISLKSYLNVSGIPNARFTTSISEIIQYPVIAKPSIGFGSIGVRTISTPDEAEKYVREFKTMIQDSPIAPYQNQYFRNNLNRPMFEEKLEGAFFRVPIIVAKGKCEAIFPIQGITKCVKRNSEYHWEEFELNHLTENERARRINNIVNQLISSFELNNGVYVAEFIEKQNGNVFLLEFSPRKSSERINKIIQLATGVDLEIEALCFFLQCDRVIRGFEAQRTVRLRLENETSPLPDLPSIYRQVEEIDDCSLYDKKIHQKYYIIIE